MSMENTNRKHRIMAILIDNPRKSLTEMSRDTGMPISTIHENIKRILEKYELKAFFVRKVPQ